MHLNLKRALALKKTRGVVVKTLNARGRLKVEICKKMGTWPISKVFVSLGATDNTMFRL